MLLLGGTFRYGMKVSFFSPRLNRERVSRWLNAIKPAKKKQYFESKGFCSDLEEGKCSYIILRAMMHAEPAERSLLRRIMLQTQRAGDASKRHKHTVLAILEKAGSLKQVTEMLHTMEKALIAEIQAVEDVMGVKNPRIRELFNAMTA